MPDTPNYYSIKVVVRDETNMVYSMFAAVLDPIGIRTIKFEGVASGSPLILLPVKSTFQDFYNRTQRVIYKGDQLKNITKSIHEVLKSSFNSESFLEELFHYIDHNLVDRIEFIFTQIHNRTAGNSNPRVEIHYELIDPADIEKTTVDEEEIARKEAPPVIVPATSGFIIPPDKQLIQFRFQLSPVNGTPLSELKGGDNVFIRLLPGDPITNAIIESLELKEESGNIKQVPAKIVNISNSKNISEVVIKINEQVYGKIVEEENSVKIKTFDSSAGAAPVLTSPASITAARKAGQPQKQKDSEDSFQIMPFIVLLVLIAAGMIAMIVYL
ncbi:hypothetical protein LPTSP3_g08310 [Leptospira kobayashii]|uniref:Uncharacterized protein n=1 Tax=Leptospira kobayashii TaxID=1917830 RepID=A0ABN6KE06_9LEPT|nr:hypothetical protein [Leptospira kobayashii]BDA77901.1 hypothetical protein LPTSP3_g08310 [Leptospira kobayashii]